MPRKRETEGRQRRPRYLAFSRDTDLTRKVESRDEFRSMLVATNGRCSEVDYFDGIKAEKWVTVGKLVVQFINADPVSLVIRVAAIRHENDYDEAWAVCDLDEFDVTSALLEASARSVGLSLSVPSFEVWLILHVSAACSGFNDAKQAGQYLKNILPNWNKTQLQFSDFQAGIWLAMARAKQLGEPPEANPSTAVWKVIESLAKPVTETVVQSEEEL
jgi:hypothetical protein